MTFDDGILTVYRTENTAQPGKKPVQRLKVKGRHYFNYGELGKRTENYQTVTGKDW